VDGPDGVVGGFVGLTGEYHPTHVGFGYDERHQPRNRRRRGLARDRVRVRVRIVNSQCGSPTIAASQTSARGVGPKCPRRHVAQPVVAERLLQVELGMDLDAIAADDQGRRCLA
jgi:hypothetical protein